MIMYNSNIHHRHSIRLHNFNYANAGMYFVTICLNQRIPKNWRYNANYDFPTFGKIENDIMILNDYGEIASNEWTNLSKRYPNISFDIFQIMPDHIHGIIQIHNIPTQTANTTHQNINVPTPDVYFQMVGDRATVGATLAVAQTTIATHQNTGITPNTGTTHQTTVTPQNPNTTNQNINVPVPDVYFQMVGDCPENRATARVAPTVTVTTVGRIVGAYKSLVSTKCLEISKQKNHVLGKLWQRNFYEHIIRNETEFSNIVKYIYDNPVLWGKEKGK